MGTVMVVLLSTSLLLALPFSGRLQAQEPRGISGNWTGTGVNSGGGTGTASLIGEEHEDGTLTGKWGAAGGEMTIEKGERATPQVLHSTRKLAHSSSVGVGWASPASPASRR
jgi:hypothetical protein